MHSEPNSSILEEQEHAGIDVVGDLLSRSNGPGGQPMIINQVIFSRTVDPAYLIADSNFAYVQANEHVTVSLLSRLPTTYATVSEISNST